MNETTSAYLARIGAKGGSAGTGAAKRRPKAHYQNAALRRWGKKANKRKTKKNSE